MDPSIHDVMNLIRDILESIEPIDGKTPIQVVQYSEDVCVVEFTDKRYRIEIKDLTQFN